MAAWDSLPTFYPNASQVELASDLNSVREHVRLVDGWSYRNEPALDSSSGLDTGLATPANGVPSITSA